MRKWINLTEAQPAEVSSGSAAGVWYHGTPYAFDAFDVNAGEFDSNHETPAIFLTNDAALAEAYASRERAPISDGLPWGEFKRDFLAPAEQIISASQAPAVGYFVRSAEQILDGTLDTAKVLDHLADVAPALRRLIGQFHARLQAGHTTEGANIRPCTVSGQFMHVRMLTDFHAGLYDLFMREAKQAGLAGVCFHDIVDSPSGSGPSADVLAVFDGKHIHPKFGLMRSLAS